MQTEEQAKCLLERPLDYPGLVRRPRAREEVRIWRAPSFDPESVWAVISDEEGWFVRRVVHRRQSVGGEIFHDTFGSEGPLSEPVALALLRGLKSISIVPFVVDSRMIVLDGARYGVEIREGLYCFRLSWCCAAPKEWHALCDWYASAVSTLEANLPPSSVPLQANHPWVE